MSCLGHGHPDVHARHARADRPIAYAHTSFFTTAVAEELAEHLVAHAPAGMSHVYLVSGGSEAIEAALKLARQYFVEIGEPRRGALHRAPPELPRQHARARSPVGGNAWRRRQFAPLLIDVDARVAVLRISRPPRRANRREEYGERLARELEDDDRARSGARA